jgi:hypothetical protein
MKIRSLLKNNRAKSILGLGQWFGLQSAWSSDFETLVGTTTKFNNLIDFATAASALVAIIILVAGGYTYIMSNGDAEKVERGTSIITNAIIGLVVIFIARLIILFVFEYVLK